MSALNRRVHRALFILVAGLMGFSLLAPVVALAAPAPSTVTNDTRAQAAVDTTTPADTSTASTGDASTATLPWAQPIDYGVVVDNNTLPADGLACRTAPGSGASEVVRLALGQSIEVTGQSQWVEGVEFLPINCAGQGGFVKKDYVQLDSEAAPVQVNTETVELAGRNQLNLVGGSMMQVLRIRSTALPPNWYYNPTV